MPHSEAAEKDDLEITVEEVRKCVNRKDSMKYEDGKTNVRVGDIESEWFGVHKGVSQGCTLSPCLFNVPVDEVTREASREFVREMKLSTGDVGCCSLQMIC